MRLYSLFAGLILVTVAACHKTSHNSVTLYGKWQWVETDWTFGADHGIIHPGRDSIVVLLFQPPASWSAVLDGTLLENGPYTSTTYCTMSPLGGCDTIITFSSRTPSPEDYRFYIGGRYFTSIHNDTLALTYDPTVITPAGASTTLKFIPSP
ncbi:hypothetical protein [Puia dinghuensis]|uniref:Uncharacterized protein n=1 Tax=Puia dinghuensis TaxID=1792502 RepID=A0A8J2XQZ0_9BACT|nr:hypothetical protein [Puia dinghuensis]GGA86750.1 hypothetical protein GCM10011511_07250 [Puia dinghuensis]